MHTQQRVGARAGTIPLNNMVCRKSVLSSLPNGLTQPSPRQEREQQQQQRARKRGVTSDDVDEATPTSTATTPSAQRRRPSASSNPIAATPPKRARSTPSKEVIAHAERAGLSAILTSILHPRVEAASSSDLDVAHSRLLVLSRSENMTTFKHRLRKGIVQGDLCFHQGCDLLSDVGLQAEMRSILDLFDDYWLRPAIAVVLHRPPISGGLPITKEDTYAALAAGRLPPIENQVAPRRALLERILWIIVLLDEAASSALMPPSAPPLFCVAAPSKGTRTQSSSFSSIEALVHHVQRRFLGKQGDVASHLRKLGAPLAYRQSAALCAPLPRPIRIDDDNVQQPPQQILLVVMRTIQLVRPDVAMTLAHALHIRPKLQKWQATQNAEAVLCATERAGVSPLAGLAPIMDELTPSGAAARGSVRQAWMRLMWDVFDAIILPRAAAETPVRNEVARLCCAGSLSHASPPGAIHGVLPVGKILETTGPYGALLLWIRTAARSGGVDEASAATIQWSSLIGSRSDILTRVAHVYGQTLTAATMGADELFETLRDGCLAAAATTSVERIGVVAAAVLYDRLVSASSRRRAACALQRRFVARRVTERLQMLRRDILLARIQARARGMRARMECRALTVLARYARARRARAMFVKMRYNAVTIQTSFRGWCACRDYAICRDACVCVQSFARGLLARRLYDEDRLAFRAAVLIQAAARGMTSRERLRDLICAAIILQAASRGRAQRLAARRDSEAAVIVQSSARRATARLIASERRRALVCIQSGARRRRAMQATSRLLQVHLAHLAATMLQRVARGWVARVRRQAQERAATTIAAHVRGRTERIVFAYVLMFVGTIQRCMRGHLGRARARLWRRAALPLLVDVRG